MTSAGGTKNMTTGSNMTGATGNMTGGAHGSSIHTTNPAGLRPSGPPGTYSIVH